MRDGTEGGPPSATDAAAALKVAAQLGDRHLSSAASKKPCAEQPWRVGCRPSAHAAGLGELGAEHLIRFERASVLPQSARYLVKKQKLARKATRVGMSHGHSASCERGHQHMEQLAHNFSRSLGWQHGKFGIFANNYQRVKTRFMFLRVCELARQGRVRSMCELGFNAGLSALLLLEAAPGATLVSFDLGDLAPNATADQLKVRYCVDKKPDTAG